MRSHIGDSTNTVSIFNSYFYRIEPSGRWLTLVVRLRCELDDEIGFCHHQEFLGLLVRLITRGPILIH